MAAVLVHRSAILLVLAVARAYIHSCDIALDHMVFLLRALQLFGTALCPQRSAVVSMRKCAVTVTMNSHTTGKYKYQMMSADSMSKRPKRPSESHEQIVSRM